MTSLCNMTMPLIAGVPLVMKLVITIWILAAVLLILIVLIQKGKGGGLGAAFGGVGGSLLGTKTGDFLTWVTICAVAVWLLLSVAAAKWFKPASSEYLQSAPAPVSAPAEKETLPQGEIQQASDQAADVAETAETAAETAADANAGQ